MAGRLIFSLRHSSKIFLNLAQIFFTLVLIFSLVRANLYFLSVYHATSNVDFFDILESFFIGLRFDLLTIAFIFVPTTILITLQGLFVVWPAWLAILHKVYLAVVWFVSCLIIYFDFFYFVKFGSHMRWEQYSQIDMGFIFTLIESVRSSQFWIFTVLLIFFAAIGYSTIYSLNFGHWKDQISPKKKWAGEAFVRIIVPLLFVAVAARGSLGQHHLRLEDSHVSQNKAINEMALNALWCFDK